MALALTVENIEGSREQRLFSSIFIPILLASRTPELPNVIYTVKPAKLNLELAKQVEEQFGSINFSELPSVIFTPVKDETDNGIRFLGSQEPVASAPVSLNSYRLLKQGYWMNARRSEAGKPSSLRDIVVMDKDRNAGARSFQMFDSKYVEFDMNEDMLEKWELFSSRHSEKDYQALSQRIFEETGLNLFEMAQALTHIYADPRIIDQAELQAGSVEEYVQAKLHIQPEVLHTLILLASPQWRANWERVNGGPQLLPAPVIKKGMRIADIPDFTRQQLFLDVQEQMTAHEQDPDFVLSVIDELALKYGLSRTNLIALTKDWPAEFRDRWVTLLKGQSALRNPLRVLDQETTQNIIDQVQQEITALLQGQEVRISSDKELAQLIGIKGSNAISSILRKVFTAEELEIRHKRIMEQALEEKGRNFSETLELRKQNLRGFLQPMMQYIERLGTIEDSIMRLPSNAQLGKMFNLDSAQVAEIIDNEFSDELIVKRRLLIRSQSNLDRKIEPIVKKEIGAIVTEQLDRIQSGEEDPLSILTYSEIVARIKAKYPDKKISVPMMSSVLSEVLTPEALELRMRLAGDRQRTQASRDVVDPEIKQGLVAFVREQLRALDAGEITTSQLYSTAQLQELFGISRGLLSKVLRAGLTDSELEKRSEAVLKQQVTRRVEYEGRAYSSASEAAVYSFLRESGAIRFNAESMQRIFTNEDMEKIIVDFVVETDKGPVAIDYHPAYMEMIDDLVEGQTPYERAKILYPEDEEKRREYLRQRGEELIENYRERRREFIPQDLEYVVLTGPEDLYDFLFTRQGGAINVGKYEFLRMFTNKATEIRKKS